MYRRLFLVACLAPIWLSSCSSRGSCDYPDDRAKDGSRCGARSAQSRPGGRNPDGRRFLWSLLGLGFVAYMLTR